MPRRTLVVGAVIVDSLDVPTRVLAARRSSPPELHGLWEFPGGKVERGEEATQALVREITEELRVSLRLGQELAHPEGTWPISERLSLRLFYAQLRDGEPSPGDSHDEVRWLASGQVRSVPWLPADEAALTPVVSTLQHRTTVR